MWCWKLPLAFGTSFETCSAGLVESTFGVLVGSRIVATLQSRIPAIVAEGHSYNPALLA